MGIGYLPIVSSSGKFWGTSHCILHVQYPAELLQCEDIHLAGSQQCHEVWDPGVLDLDFDNNETWFDAISDLPLDKLPAAFDEVGDYTKRVVVQSHDALYSWDTSQHIIDACVMVHTYQAHYTWSLPPHVATGAYVSQYSHPWCKPSMLRHAFLF